MAKPQTFRNPNQLLSGVAFSLSLMLWWPQLIKIWFFSCSSTTTSNVEPDFNLRSGLQTENWNQEGKSFLPREYGRINSNKLAKAWTLDIS
jgi:hypothetical protein